MEVINETQTQNFKKNRKRKKNFLQNARKYGKKGNYGRGSHIDEDIYNYFVRSLEIYKKGFAGEEEKLCFVNNVFEQTINEEINYSCNQIGCRLIETLLPFANDEVILRYINAFSSDLRPLCSDRFATHVIEALISLACLKSLQDDSKTDFKNFAVKISKFILNNLEDYINNTYGNHLIRSILLKLSGLSVDGNKKGGTIKKEVDSNEEYIDIIKEYISRLILWPQFKDLPYNELTSGLLQILLQVLYNINLKLLKSVQKKLLVESYAVLNEDTNLPQVFQNVPATMCLEISLNVSTAKTFALIYENCFKGHLGVLVKKKGNNMAVQKLLNNCKDKTEFEEIYEELSEHFEAILQCGHTGVILAIAQTCKSLTAKQGPFLQQLMKTLHCSDSEEAQNKFVLAVTRLVPLERLEALQKEHYFINLHGSLVLQTLLEFNKPIKIINSLLNLSNDELEKMFCDMKGSHIVDSYMKSQFVGEKSREKLTRKMFGSYQNLVLSKYGSRSFEAIWNMASLKLKMNIIDELGHKDRLWTSSEFGKIIASKINFELYKRNKDEWKQFVSKSNKTKDILADIIKE